MKRLIGFGCVWLAVASIPIEALADTWPKLNGGRQKECTEALQIAEKVFESDSFFLYEPPQILGNTDSVLVLKPQALDISAGDALEADEKVFDKLPIGGDSSPRSVYWQKGATSGYRLVVQEMPHGWRGDRYSLFAVSESISPDKFLADVRKSDRSTIVSATIPDTWRPPLILRMEHSSRLWVIDVGDPYEILGDWKVYVAEPEGLKTRCTVRFRPKVKKITDLLPKPVRELALLLDQTLGRGENEGTLQPTAMLRLSAEHTWANAAMRPWVSGKPYNTRAEVDAGLESWSKRGAAYRRVYQQINRQYALAERSLAKYYRIRFGKSVTVAASQASYILDIAFRSHYAFHSDAENSYFRDTNSAPNPWRKR